MQLSKNTADSFGARGLKPRAISVGKMVLNPKISVSGFSDAPSFAKSVTEGIFFADAKKMVGVNGVEPLTPRLSSACSNQLSYTPGGNPKSERRNPNSVGGAEEIRTPDL